MSALPATSPEGGGNTLALLLEDPGWTSPPSSEARRLRELVGDGC